MVMSLWQSSKVSSEWIDKRAASDFVMRPGNANKFALRSAYAYF